VVSSLRTVFGPQWIHSKFIYLPPPLHVCKVSSKSEFSSSRGSLVSQIKVLALPRIYYVEIQPLGRPLWYYNSPQLLFDFSYKIHILTIPSFNFDKKFEIQQFQFQHYNGDNLKTMHFRYYVHLMIFFLFWILNRFPRDWLTGYSVSYIVSIHRLRFDIHCQYWKSIVYATCTVDFLYWQWISKRSLYIVSIRDVLHHKYSIYSHWFFTNTFISFIINLINFDQNYIINLIHD